MANCGRCPQHQTQTEQPHLAHRANPISAASKLNPMRWKPQRNLNKTPAGYVRMSSTNHQFVHHKKGNSIMKHWRNIQPFLAGVLAGLPTGACFHYMPLHVAFALLIVTNAALILTFFQGIAQVRKWKKDNSNYWKAFLEE